MTILEKWGITAERLTQVLEKNPSLRGMILGYVAEQKLKEIISTLTDVSFITKFDDHNRKKKGDLYIIYKNRAFNIESKSLQTNMVKRNEKTGAWEGKAQVDGSDRRDVIFPNGKKLNTTLLLRGEFDILAVNCYAFEEKWNFQFAKNSDLPCSTYKKYTKQQRNKLIASLVPVKWPPEIPFRSDLKSLLDEMVQAGLGQDPEKIE
ncbi:MAG TPA: hypothetical protein VJ440_09310 [Candidatus Brocadiaceae bacterium]|nr:hypothetical protein [Candidatus Brocadiaceae bacterium]